MTLDISIPTFGIEISKVILNYFDITEKQSESDPRRTATCRTCGKLIEIIVGSSPYSSHTRTLKCHLKMHTDTWEDYLYDLSKIMTQKLNMNILSK